MKRTALFITILCLCLTIAWADQPAKTGDKDTLDPITVPRMAIALALDNDKDDKAGAISLLASEFTQNEIPLVPTNVNVVSVLETPVLVSVSIPKDKHRTHLLVAAGAGHSWTQIPSTASYRMTGSFSFYLTSTALPSPGQMRIRLILADSQIETQPSSVEISRLRDPAQSFGLDEKIMAYLVKGNFPALTDEEALQTARSLLRSNIKIEMKMEVRLKSVSEFDVGNATLQVWGD